MGMAFAIPSFGVLVGCPIFGHILKVTNSYTCMHTGPDLFIHSAPGFD